MLAGKKRLATVVKGYVWKVNDLITPGISDFIVFLDTSETCFIESKLVEMPWKDPRKFLSAKQMKFLTSRAAQESVAHSAQAIPARRSVATSDAFLHPRVLVERGLHTAGPPHTSQVPVARFKPRFSTVPQAKHEFQQGIEPLWNGTLRDGRRVTARELLEQLQPRIEAIVEGE